MKAENKRLNKILTKEFLIQEYIINKKSTYQIAKMVNCSVMPIRRRLKKDNIKLRTTSEANKGLSRNDKYSKILTKTFLIREYVKNKKTTHQIAKEVGCSYESISRYLKIHNIPIRTHSESLVDKYKGNKNPNWKCGKPKCLDCGKQLTGYNSKRCKLCSSIGKNNPNYIHGHGNFPYPLEFNKQLKETIRKRDNYICQKCGMTEEESLVVYRRILDVHHIDYNKNNCKEDNLIALCNNCNIKVNHNRDYWQVYFKNKIKELNYNGCYI